MFYGTATIVKGYNLATEVAAILYKGPQLNFEPLVLSYFPQRRTDVIKQRSRLQGDFAYIMQTIKKGAARPNSV